MLGWALLERVEDGVVERWGSLNLLLRPAWALGQLEALAGEARGPAWGLCIGCIRALGMRGAQEHSHLQARGQSSSDEGCPRW